MDDKLFLDAGANNIVSLIIILELAKLIGFPKVTKLLFTISNSSLKRVKSFKILKSAGVK